MGAATVLPRPADPSSRSSAQLNREFPARRQDLKKTKRPCSMRVSSVLRVVLLAAAAVTALTVAPADARSSSLLAQQTHNDVQAAVNGFVNSHGNNAMRALKEKKKKHKSHTPSTTVPYLETTAENDEEEEEENELHASTTAAPAKKKKKKTKATAAPQYPTETEEEKEEEEEEEADVKKKIAAAEEREEIKEEEEEEEKEEEEYGASEGQTTTKKKNAAKKTAAPAASDSSDKEEEEREYEHWKKAETEEKAKEQKKKAAAAADESDSSDQAEEAREKEHWMKAESKEIEKAEAKKKLIDEEKKEKEIAEKVKETEKEAEEEEEEEYEEYEENNFDKDADTPAPKKKSSKKHSTAAPTTKKHKKKSTVDSSEDDMTPAPKKIKEKKIHGEKNEGVIDHSSEGSAEIDKIDLRNQDQWESVFDKPGSLVIKASLYAFIAYNDTNVCDTFNMKMDAVERKPDGNGTYEYHVVAYVDCMKNGDDQTQGRFILNFIPEGKRLLLTECGHREEGEIVNWIRIKREVPQCMTPGQRKKFLAQPMKHVHANNATTSADLSTSAWQTDFFAKLEDLDTEEVAIAGSATVVLLALITILVVFIVRKRRARRELMRTIAGAKAETAEEDVELRVTSTKERKSLMDSSKAKQDDLEEGSFVNSPAVRGEPSVKV